MEDSLRQGAHAAKDCVALGQAREQRARELPPLLVQAQPCLPRKGLRCWRDCTSCCQHVSHLRGGSLNQQRQRSLSCICLAIQH